MAVGARLLHYVPFRLPIFVDRLISQILHYQIWGLLVAFVALPAALVVLAVMVALLVVRRRWCVDKQGGRWATRPWLTASIWTLLFAFNGGLDMDPRTSLMAWTSLPALLPVFWTGLDRGARWVKWVLGAALWTAFFGFWVARTDEPVERAIAALWAAFIIPFAALLNRRTLARDRLGIALLFSAVVQFMLSELPRKYPNHGGTQIGTKDYAYTFCEMPERGRLFAAVPCDGSRNGCTDGFVAEHDVRDLTRYVEHHFFSDAFSGRLVHLLCLEDTVQVGMARSRVEGVPHRENVMEFVAEDPRQFRKSLYGGLLGPRIAHDRRHDAIFYISEWSNRIYRFDRRTRALDDTVGRAIYGAGDGSFGSHLMEAGSFHERRDSLFVVQWLSGSRIFEIDRSTFDLVQSYDAHHGGSHGIAVDDELDHIWVPGIWGIDVLEVGTGRRLSRSRLGLGCRLPVIDRRHDIVYVPNSAGRLWALDRRTFATLGSLLVGGGSRNPYISLDGQRLFASAQHGYFYWETSALAKRFR